MLSTLWTFADTAAPAASGSASPPSTTTFDDLEAFLAHVAREQPGQPLFLLGHSMGGAIVVRLALSPPAADRRLDSQCGGVADRRKCVPGAAQAARLMSRFWPRLRLVRLGDRMLALTRGWWPISATIRWSITANFPSAAARRSSVPPRPSRGKWNRSRSPCRFCTAQAIGLPTHSGKLGTLRPGSFGGQDTEALPGPLSRPAA